MFEEIPPTAGMPARLGDLLPPWKGGFARLAADFLGAPEAGLECSGTASLIVILKALQGMSPRRTVVVPAYTCPLVALAVVHCGLRIRLCDLARDSFELDPLMLSVVCDQDTLAIVPTHLAGRVAKLDEVRAIARKHGAHVVEDAAQSFGARQGGASIGINGDAGFFSFALGKGLTLYEGGLWVARDPRLRAAIARTSASLISSDGWLETLRCLQLAGYALLYRPLPLRVVYGLPLRRALRRGDPVTAAGDDFPAAIPLHRVGRLRQSAGCRALSRLSDFQSASSSQAAKRLPLLRQLSGVKVFDDNGGAAGVWPSFLLLMPSGAARDAALAELWGSGLGVTRMFAHALPDYAYLQPMIPPVDVPAARDFAARTLSVSNSLWLDDGRFARIVDALRESLRQA